MSVGGMMGLVVKCALLLAGITGTWKLVGGMSNEARYRAVCASNLSNIGLALHNYHLSQGCLPPAYVVDREGKPLYSWRVLMLPYMEEAGLYQSFHLDEPWDSPHNRTLISSMPTFFACSTMFGEGGEEQGLTSYLAVTGGGTAFDKTRATRFDEVEDGLGRTILVVENSQASVPWTAPFDLDSRSGRVLGPPSKRLRGGGSIRSHPGGFNALDGAGKVRYVDAIPFWQNLKAVATVKGGESVDLDALQAPAPGAQRQAE
jgi:hypothetical protein